jgi:hypothetical protein
MDDHPSDHGQHASRAPANGLAALRRQYPDWHITRGTGSDPLGYSAIRDGCLITAQNLDRLGDLLAGAGQPDGRPPAILITGPPGWNSGRAWTPAARSASSRAGGRSTFSLRRSRCGAQSASAAARRGW